MSALERTGIASLLVGLLALAAGAPEGAGASGRAGLEDLDQLPREARQIYWAVKPGEDELPWRQIPWLTDLAEAVRVARAERRPLFLWVAGDEPLDRC